MSASLNCTAWNDEIGCPNCAAPAGVLRGQVEHGLGQAEREGGDGDAPDLEGAQELAEAQIGVADQVVVGDLDVVEVQLAGVEAAPPDAAHLRTHGEAGGVPLDDEAGESRAPPFAGLGAGQQRHPERHVRPGVGDERLGPVDHPAAVPPHGAGADPPGVGAGVGLGEPERAEGAALGQRTQPPVALGVVAEQQQRQRSDRHVGLPGGGHRLVGQTDLLHGGDEADRRHPDPAPLLGDEHAEEAQPPHLPE